MGIPKFFRFMSERYPLISQLIQENRIPEFDALYLDMNGIIHNCSHPNDNDASFRITEEAIFLAVFAYVSHLFSVIKPKKTFFLAIDGVAPRAKMNQQRSRRFRTAKEAKEVLDKAKRRGEEIPEGDGFDSNCITPGTPFMARLSAQLKYFIAKKVSEDSDWRGVEIILSGHEVPGEGEHKIMEYIRLTKAQPGYDANMRHCLYGLDADLIMLGLLSHDPHFCLLREEVTFGPRGGKGKTKSLESQNFFLMHLSLFREYLDLEFSSLRDSLSSNSFEYDLERIIDDFILLNIFVGNDFLPHLPGLHINEGALNRLFEIYKRVLPRAGGYINDNGRLNVERLQLILNELGVFEREHFEYEFADSNWFKGKQTGSGGATGGSKGRNKHMEKAMETARAKGRLVLTETQKKLFLSLQSFLLSSLSSLDTASTATYQFPNDLSAKDKKFLSDFSDELKLVVTYDEFNDDGENLVTVSFDDEIIRLAREEEEEDEEGEDGRISTEEEEGDESSEAEEIGIVHLNLNGNVERIAQKKKMEKELNGGEKEESEWQRAIKRVLKKYEKAEVSKEYNEEEFEQEMEREIQEKMITWKADYYKEKLEFDPIKEPKAVDDLAYRYIEGLQWVLHYYYQGVASWGWFYNYHYAPKMTDLNKAASYKFDFDLGKPFKPFEQLMGVLPDLSSAHIPPAFRDLMSDPTSPIIDFYPVNFAQDLNGKKQDWEAIVKIPFIDEERLLKTMATRFPRLTKEENARNSFGDSWSFKYDENLDQTYPTSLPGFFPDLVHNHTRLEAYHLPTLEGGLKLVKGLLPGVLLGKDAISGFPSLNTISHTGSLGFHGVNVFQSDSRKETMVIQIDNSFENLSSEQIAQAIVGKRIFVGYPYLREAFVDSIQDELFKYQLDDQDRVVPTPQHQGNITAFKRAADRIEHVYSKSRACLIGNVDIIVNARPLKGLKRQDDGSAVKEWEEETGDFALQATVTDVVSEDIRYVERPPIPLEEEYPVGCNVFFLGPAAYGTPAQVLNHVGNHVNIRIAYFATDKAENAIFKTRLSNMRDSHYSPAHSLGRIVNMSGLALSKICSSLLVLFNDQRVNIGLNLKFEAKGLKVLGYSRKGDGGWEYSQKAVELIQEYREKFPEVAFALSRKGDLTHAEDFFDRSQVDARMKELIGWIKEKGVRDFEKVPLYSEQLEKDAVQAIEKLADSLVTRKRGDSIKMAQIKGIPRQALLKPEYAPARLREQEFSLGDRVVTVIDSGNVPLSAKGVVIGIQTNFIDVVFDVQFMSGTTLGDRCSPFRGATVSPYAVLNLSRPQFTQGQGAPTAAPKAPVNNNARFKGGMKNGAGPSILPAQGLPAGGFHPAAGRGRGRGGFAANGGVQVLRANQRSVDPATSFGSVANGTAPAVQQPVAASPSAAQPTSHQQRLGQTLGIRGGAHPLRGGPQFGRGGFFVQPQAPHQTQGFGNHPAATFVGGPRGMARGGAGPNAVHVAGPGGRGGGVGIPPPANLNAPRGGGRGRGGPRGGFNRGGRGGAQPGAGGGMNGQQTSTA
ncbi:chromatin-binding exonuclease XRN1 [Sporobolomyces salmoneus]|uniref:chromatin-binding exonuclease XRN1 n=1 Tax=Sporobolomyces salmoneus TaxID=183962 RepID=UPI00317BB2B8